MLELIYKHIIDKNIKEIVAVLSDALSSNGDKSKDEDSEQRKQNILNLIMALLLYHLKVDGIKIRYGEKEIGNFTEEKDFVKVGSWKVNPNKPLDIDGLEITSYEYYKDNDSAIVNFDEFSSIFPKLTNFEITKKNSNKHNAKDILLGYVFHLDDFVAVSEASDGFNKLSAQEKFEKLSKDYECDQRFRLFENIFKNIRDKAEPEIAREGLNDKIHVQLAFGHNNGSGSYFFFNKTFKDFSKASFAVDKLKQIIQKPTPIMEEKEEGLLFKMKTPQRYGPMWAIFTDSEYPDYLKYVKDESQIWETEKKVFFNTEHSNEDGSVYFMGAIPFISFEEMHLYLYLVGSINGEEDLKSLRKVIAFLSYYLVAISENTKKSLEIMKTESEKATLKKHYISEGLQGDNLLKLATKTDAAHKEYVEKLLNSFTYKLGNQ